MIQNGVQIKATDNEQQCVPVRLTESGLNDSEIQIQCVPEKQTEWKEPVRSLDVDCDRQNEIGCDHCRRVKRRILGVHLDRMNSIQYVPENKEESDKINDEFPLDLVDIVRSKEKVKRKKSSLKKQLRVWQQDADKNRRRKWSTVCSR